MAAGQKYESSRRNITQLVRDKHEAAAAKIRQSKWRVRKGEGGGAVADTGGPGPPPPPHTHTHTQDTHKKIL